MSDSADRASWKTLPPPNQREYFELPLSFTDADGDKLLRGHIPEDMDDKWFIFFENSWLYFHRSWTGSCIFGVRLDGFPLDVRILSAWVSRDDEAYKSPGIETERVLVKQLIQRLLA